jgi:hypothetical protein
MGRKAQVVLQINEDVIGSFIQKFFGGDRKKGIGVLSLLVEDYIKDFVLGKKDIKIMVLDKEGGDDPEYREYKESVLDPRD